MPLVESVTLCGVLPAVFRGDVPAESEIWLAGRVELRRGCRVCISTESGRGKSSLISFLYGSRDDYDGTILFDSTDIRSFSVDRWCDMRTRSLAILPQELCLFPELTVMENIEIKNRLTSTKTTARIIDMLARTGLSGKLHEPVGRLSLGQRQRVAAVRAVCQPFDFLLLDEPVSHLDETNNRILASLLQEEADERGAGIISTSVGNPLLLDNAEVMRL